MDPIRLCAVSIAVQGPKVLALSINGAVGLLSRTPTALFPIALGLAGLGVALRIASVSLSTRLLLPAGDIIVILAACVLVIDMALYLTKLVRSRSAVAEDLSMPSRANLLAPGFMATMVIGGVWADSSMIGGPIWQAASIGHLLLILGFVGRWLTHDFMPEDLNPTWFLPAAGIMTSALTWPGYGPIELPIFLIGVGGMLWGMLLPLVFRRIVFEPAVSPQLRPTLFITAAPFALMAGALMTVFPTISIYVPLVLLSGGVFFILVLLFQFRFIAKAGISLSWWATTFPVATVATGFLRIGEKHGLYSLLTGTALLVLACLTTAIAILATIRAAWCTCTKTVSGTEKQIAAMQGNV